MLGRKKKTSGLEEDVIIYDENDSIAKSRQKSRRVFVFYIIALFSVALVIILASYVVQAHQQKQLEDMDAKLNKQVDVAEGAKDRAQKMQDQLEALQTKVDELQKQLDKAEGDLTSKSDELKETEEDLKEQKQNVQALNLMWKLEKAYLSGEYDDAEELIDQMDELFGRSTLTDLTQTPLTRAAAVEYSDICNALGV